MASDANDSEPTGSDTRRGLVRASCTALSLFAILVSMGATGIGWMLASLVLMAAGVLLPVMGGAWFGVCLTIMLWHMVFVGPLHGIELVAGEYRRNALIVASVPLALGLAAAVVQAWRHR